MRDFNEHTATDAILGKLKDCKDPRLEQVMTSVVPNLDLDALFGVKDLLVVSFILQDSLADRAASGIDQPLNAVDFEFGLVAASRQAA
jgi:hypothetical protein